MSVTLSPTQVRGMEDLARNRGFDLVGQTTLEVPEQDQENLKAFVADERHGDMVWFERHLALRLDPALLLPGARSAFVFGAQYRRPDQDEAMAEARVKVSRYAQGRDYHRLLRRRAKAWLADVRSSGVAVQGRVAVDSAPVPEKILARLAGLGWQGKHTNLIHPRLGSYFFLAVVLLDRALPVEHTAEIVADRCGSCRLCIDACPTGALEPYRIDARRCISYLTIENRGPLPAPFEPKLEGWAFGCDICQEVCPYNTPASTVPERRAGWDEFAPRPSALRLMDTGRLDDWEELTTGSALRRVSRENWERNLQAAARSRTGHGDSDGNGP